MLAASEADLLKVSWLDRLGNVRRGFEKECRVILAEPGKTKEPLEKLHG